MNNLSSIVAGRRV